MLFIPFQLHVVEAELLVLLERSIISLYHHIWVSVWCIEVL